MKKAQGGKIRAISCVCLGLLFSLSAKAQFSNEWINYGQEYYKIPVARDGIYKLSYSALQAAGVPVGSLDPRRINLFHRGNEQAIFVQGQDDARFDPADFIEFYGRKNDGTLDASLYKPGMQPHSLYNLFNDTTAYFLTWNPLPVAGKRMSSFSEPSGGLIKEPYHNGSRLELYTTEYAGGLTLNGEVQATIFDQGEGWTGQMICSGSGCMTQRDFIIDNLTGAVPSAAAPSLEVVLVGRGTSGHVVEVYAGPNAGSLNFLTNTTLFGFETAKLNLPLLQSDIGADGRITVRIRLASSGSSDRISLSYAKVVFGQDFNLSGVIERTFGLLPNVTGKSYVEFPNPVPGSRIWDVTDPGNAGMIGSFGIAGGIGAVVPNTTSARTLFVSSFTIAPSIRKVTFRSITPSLHNFIVVSHRALMKPALGYDNAVQAYAGYRASPAGGRYDTLAVPMDLLYNQFNYGETSPRAVYQFMKFMIAGGQPRYLFLVGKGLEVSQGFHRKTTLLPGDYRDLVPSAGMPAADIAFTAGLNGTTYEPAVPTGRISASTANEVAGYLNKIKESESAESDELWRKDLLHLSGGINAGEPALFRSYMDGFKAVAESYYLGGKVETISKQTLNVELINIQDQVNKGLNLITFFGHSGPGTIDIDIGYVSDPTMGYNNKGKYTSFLINGCNAGRFFDNRLTFGEDWILTAEKGAKSFIAHSSFGLSLALKQYSDTFYAVAYGDSTFARQGIGDVHKETGRRFLAASGTGLFATTQVQQMFLLGDPAVRLFDSKKPDYQVDDGTVAVVSLDGKAVTAQSDSFAIDIGVSNFGRALPGLFKVRVERTLSDNSKINYDSLFNPVLYGETLRMKIRKGRSNAEFGNTIFKVILDPDNEFAELNESNNVATIHFFIPLNGTKNLHPAPYSIIHSTSVQLMFQNTDLLAGVRGFRVELDTASTFDSPYLKRMTVNGQVIAKASVSLLAEDSTVYYWRTILENPGPEESSVWTTSSFAYIVNSPEGWGQMKFPQFAENPVTGLVKDPEIQLLRFQETTSTVDVKTFGSAHPAPHTDVSLVINGEEFNVSPDQPCRDNSLNLIAFDKSSTAPYAGLPFGHFDPKSCGREPQMINNFIPSEMITGSGNDLAQWVANVKASDSVVVFSIGDAGYASWPAAVMMHLEQIGVGSNQLNGIQPGEPFVIFGRKGSAPGTALIFRPSQSPLNSQELTVEETITGGYTEGTLQSTVIGPASEWSDLSIKIKGASGPDVFGVDVTGIDLSGNETLLKSQLTGTNSLTDINASMYPYLRLALKTKDEIDLTPVQLRNWIVHFTPVAEGILVYSGSHDQEEVFEGQTWSSSYAFTNISPVTFKDSLTVRTDFFSADAQSASSGQFRIKAPLPGDSTKFSVHLDTRGWAGTNDVTVFVNPRVQPEMYYDNNVLAQYEHLKVIPDRTAPLLRVTVDGRQITNGDLVGISPVIALSLVDKNPFLPKADTVGINLFVRYPCLSEDCPYIRIAFTRNDVSWTAGTASSDFSMIFRPVGLPLGNYVLKAEAEDGSGNPSGQVPYEVNFRVTDETEFQLQSVYPNPSSGEFFFRIFLGGPEPPSDFQLEIFSSAGSLVRTFGNESLSSFHVGTNDVSITATDPSGNPLPAGIYFFRLRMVTNGSAFSKSGSLAVVR